MRFKFRAKRKASYGAASFKRSSESMRANDSRGSWQNEQKTIVLATVDGELDDVETVKMKDIMVGLR